MKQIFCSPNEVEIVLIYHVTSILICVFTGVLASIHFGLLQWRVCHVACRLRRTEKQSSQTDAIYPSEHLGVLNTVDFRLQTQLE